MHPPYDYPDYRSSAKRAPKQALIAIPQEFAVTSGPRFDTAAIGAALTDLTHALGGEAIGERIILSGRVLDDTEPVAGALVEVWQANAAGRYRHEADQHAAPLDPHFTGKGYALTGEDGAFRFITVKPGPYPWLNHPNAWRPSHVHFSVFGPRGARVITQMYFPGDPLLPLDPILNSVPDAGARERLIARFDHDGLSEEGFALGYRFDIVTRGRNATPLESASQTAGPFFRDALHRPDWEDLTAQLEGRRVRIHGRLLDGDGEPVPDGMIEVWQADAAGRYAEGTSRGFGRVCTNERGEFTVTTVIPGAVAQNGVRHAPQLNLTIFARGLLRQLVTRMYFADRENEGDAVLRAVPAARRSTLLAVPNDDGSYRFDIILQGRGETVFFEI